MATTKILSFKSIFSKIHFIANILGESHQAIRNQYSWRESFGGHQKYHNQYS
jgi:hypothetical protein